MNDLERKKGREGCPSTLADARDARRPSWRERIERGAALSGFDPLALAVTGREGLGWFVASVTEGGETLAMKAIRKGGCPAYCPEETVTTIYRKWKREVERPLLPGYLFLAFAPELPPDPRVWRRYGVTGLLCRAGAAGRPAQVPETAVMEIMRSELNGEFDRVERPQQRGGTREATEHKMAERGLCEGTSVLVTQDGPWRNMVGQLRNAERDHRITIMMQAMFREVPVELPLSAVQKL